MARAAQERAGPQGLARVAAPRDAASRGTGGPRPHRPVPGAGDRGRRGEGRRSESGGLGGEGKQRVEAPCRQRRKASGERRRGPLLRSLVAGAALAQIATAVTGHHRRSGAEVEPQPAARAGALVCCGDAASCGPHRGQQGGGRGGRGSRAPAGDGSGSGGWHSQRSEDTIGRRWFQKAQVAGIGR